MPAELLPFSRRLRSSLSWQTICGPWCRWLRSSGCHSVLSGPPAAGFLTDLSNRSWSGRGIAPAKTARCFFFVFFLYLLPEKHTRTLHADASLVTPAYLPRHNLLIDLDGLICKEWRVASCHFIDEDSQGPPVHCFVVTLENSMTASWRHDTKQALPPFQAGLTCNVCRWHSW